MSVSLRHVTDASLYGGKAAALGAGLRAGLPVPDGVALSWPEVESVAAGDLSLHSLEVPSPCSVRSSAVGEDSASASFAGMHLSVLGVEGASDVADAVRAVRESAYGPGAVAYRATMGLTAAPRMAVVIQELLDSDVAGVMFTRNPVTGADERVIEASWGLGEAVVSGLVTPDHWVADSNGRILSFLAGDKDLAMRRVRGEVVQVAVQAGLVHTPCLDAAALRALHELATACDRAYGSTAHDIEFAFAAGRPYLLQRRPITRG